MSSQRHAPPSDGRSAKDRSPPRNAGSGPLPHPSRNALIVPSATTDSPAAVPRGPKALGDARGGVGPSPGRGRGTPARGDFRPEFRERDSFRGSRELSPAGDRPRRDYDWREGPHEHPSHNDFRSSRDTNPREFDAVRGRRGFRDGPPGRFADTRGPPGFPPSRDDFSRGRGRGEWATRGRGRASYYEDRPGFRTRSRSPPRAYRSAWDDRGDDRYEIPRYERREPEASLDREERAREAERYRRERLSISTAPNRGLNPSPGPHSPVVVSAGPSLVNRPSSSGRDFQPQRRASTTSGPLSRPFQRSDQAGNKDNPVGESLPSRPSSPPPAPEVPAFGSIPLKSGTGNEGPWNVWKAPAEPRVNPSVGAATTTPAPPAAAVNSKPSSAAIAPKAPKAQRSGSFQVHSETSNAAQHRPREERIGHDLESLSPVISTHSAPTPKMHDTQQLDLPLASRVPPTGPRQVPGAPSGPKSHLPSGPRASSGSINGPTPLASPKFPHPTSAPSAPRAALANNSAAKLGNSIPTGPRSSQPAPPPTSRVPTGPASDRPWQRSRSDVAQQGNRPAIGLLPAKRDADGIAKAAGNVKAAIGEGSEDGPDRPPNAQRPSKRITASEERKDTANATSAGSDGDLLMSRVYSSDEDDEEMNEDDSAQNEQRYEQNKARLESQKIDLTSSRLCASEELRSLSLLTCLLLQDPSLFFEVRQPKTQPRQAYETPAEPDSSKNEEPRMMAGHLPKPSPKLTPSPISTPELKTLPFLNAAPMTPVSDLGGLMTETLKRQEAVKDVLAAEIRRRTETVLDEEDVLREEYEELYMTWRARTRELDRQKAKLEEQRQVSAEITVEPPPSDLSPVVTASAEPRRRGFTSEYELQKILELSREEAEREAQARKLKELANAKPDYEKEAVIPEIAPQLVFRAPEDRDVCRLEDPDFATAFWELEPPEDTFTEEEHETMLQNFREYPKKFGKIAQGLATRTYKDCINHYYATKWNAQYKTPRDKKKGQKLTSKRARTGAGSRPRANQLISNLDDAKPDLYDGEEANAPLMAVTESGRPRRAAAPNFREREQVDQATASARRGAKNEAVNAEKATRKPRTTTDKRSRKPKTQVAAVRQPSMSPEKQLVEGKVAEVRYAPSVGDAENVMSVPPVAGPLAFGKPEVPPPYTQEYAGHALGVLPSEAGKIQTVRGGHVGPSSYWSVHEVNQFPQLIKHYGTDWAAISNAMGTKSQTMVKNYFGRLKNTGKESEIEAWAHEADSRRERGEIPVALPNSTTPVRRPRTDTLQSSTPRALAPSTDAMDLDEDPSHNSAQQTQLQQSGHGPPFTPAQHYASHLENRHDRSSSFGQHPMSNASPTAPSTHGTYSGAPPPTADYRSIDRRDTALAHAGDHHLAKPSTGESSTEGYSSAPKNLWERSSRGGEVFQPPVFVQHPSGGMIRASSPSHFPERPLFGPTSARGQVERHQPEEYARAQGRRPRSPGLVDNRSREEVTRDTSDDFVENSMGGMIRAPASSQRFVERPLFSPASSRGQTGERPLPEDLARSQLRRAESPPPSSSLRYVTEGATQRPASTSFFDPARNQSSNVMREDVRTTPRSMIMGSTKAPTPASKPEGRKTSNLMSLLNNDPDPPPPTSHPQPPQPPSHNRMQTPPHYTGSGHSGHSSSAYPPPRPPSQPNRMDVAENTRGHQQHPPRPAFSPPEASEAKHRKPASYRPEWPRASHDRLMDPAMAYDPRNIVRSYDNRYNPSPPPPPPHEGAADAGHSYEQRLQQAHYGPSYRPGSPPVRPYGSYAPPSTMSHSRDSSSSRMPPRESLYPSEHRHASSLSGEVSHRYGERLPPQIAAPSSMQGNGSTYASQSAPSAYGAVRPPHPHALSRNPSTDEEPRAMAEWSRERADWTQGIQYREPAERTREVERGERREMNRGRDRSADDGRDRYAPVGYGPVGGQPPYAPRGERG